MAVAWSPEAESYLELLGSFAKIERETDTRGINSRPA